MKTIYLRDEKYNWKDFKYENIKDLSNELKQRNISIGYDACKNTNNILI